MSGELIEDLVTVGASLQERDRLREELLVETEQREKFKDQRDRLAVQLQEAFASCDMMREELAAVTRERNEWRAGAASQQEQATHLRQQVEALKALLKDSDTYRRRLREQVAELQAQLPTSRNTDRAD